jgi:predicted Zn-dependent peptidase
MVNAGTRDESEIHSGLAHFVEHTIFKGTAKRNGNQVIRRIEDVGGDLNASTSKEETYFHTSFLSPFYKRAVELLADIFFNSTFPEKEIQKEKTVVLEEINYYNDTPTELIFDEIENLIFYGHPLGRNILGTKKSVKNIKRDNILDFINENYTIPNIVLASAGAITTSQLKQLCERYFGATNVRYGARWRPPFAQYQPQYKQVHKATNQTHIVLANQAYSFMDDKKNPFMLLINLLGGQGMSARLNMAIREKRGLAYSVEASYSGFSDSGLFTIYIGCDNEHIEQCIELVYREMKKLCQQKISTLQLHYAKNQFLGQLAIANESKLNEMLSLGRTALFFDEVETIEEAIANIQELSAEKLQNCANELLQREQMTTLIYSRGR